MSLKENLKNKQNIHANSHDSYDVKAGDLFAVERRYEDFWEVESVQDLLTAQQQVASMLLKKLLEGQHGEYENFVVNVYNSAGEKVEINIQSVVVSLEG